MLEKSASKQKHGEKSFIVYGPQGSGKTLHAEALRKALGLATVWDEGETQERLDQAGFGPIGVLYLTIERPAWVPDYSRRCMPLDEALKHAGVVPLLAERA